MKRKQIIKFKNILNVSLVHSLNSNEIFFYALIEIIIYHLNKITQKNNTKLIIIEI